MAEHVKIVEVGPRDGLQNEKAHLSTFQRVALVQSLLKTGLKVVEAGAFVSPKWVPQMAGTAEVLAELGPQKEGVELPVLVPNFQGFEAALASGAKHIAIFSAASDVFNQKNTNATIEESFVRFAPIMAAAKENGISVRGYVSTVVGCPYSGKIAPIKVAEVAGRLFDMGCVEISLGDTIGVARPKEIKAMLKAVQKTVPLKNLALHCHDTYGQAIANIYAGLEEGMRIFDASVAGLGGCPYAKGASGNVATEDVVYLLQGEGFQTGIDLAALSAVGAEVSALLGRQNGAKAGLAIENIAEIDNFRIDSNRF